MWRLNPKGLAKEVLPTQPIIPPTHLDPWWTVSVVNLTETEFRGLDEIEVATLKTASLPRGEPCAVDGTSGAGDIPLSFPPPSTQIVKLILSLHHQLSSFHPLINQLIISLTLTSFATYQGVPVSLISTAASLSTSTGEASATLRFPSFPTTSSQSPPSRAL